MKKTRSSMRSAPQRIAPVTEGHARHTATVPASLHDLDYATWHARVAGNASQFAPSQVAPEGAPNELPELDPAAVERSSRRAA
jgi:hypothetical protein